jgi:hypothetical protein
VKVSSFWWKKEEEKRHEIIVKFANESNMVNVVVDPLSDHVGYHILHWIVSQSGAWYTKVNENLQDNLRSLETGVGIIDEILTPKEDDNQHENQQRVGVEENIVRFELFQRNSNEHHINILNQIINMNISYNDGSGSNDRGGFRGNQQRRPSCEFVLFFQQFSCGKNWV